MRALRTAILIAATMALTCAAVAQPTATPGYAVEIEAIPGAVFSGLTRDGGDLIVTNLGDGRLYRRAKDGVLAAFGPLFPHGIDIIGDPTGPYRAVPLGGGGYLVAQGWTPVDDDEGPFDHALVTVSPDGETSVLNNTFWNPFDFARDGDRLFVVDSAANAIVRLPLTGGSTETVVTFARLEQAASGMQALSPTEFTETYTADAVPTGIVIDDGRAFVSLFGGFPFVAGAGRIVSFALADGLDMRTEVDDLNAPVDVFVEDGRTLILEHGLYNQATGFLPGSGRLLEVDQTTGKRQTILDGLTRPASVLVWDAGHIMVSDLIGNLIFLSRDPVAQAQERQP